MMRPNAKKRVKPGKSDKETRYKMFAEHYLQNGGNGFQAAVSAGYSKGGAASASQRLLKNTAIKHILTETRARSFAGMEITTDRVLREAARLAFFDPRKLLNVNGEFRQLAELDDDTAAAIAGIEYEDLFAGRGQNRVIIGKIRKIKLWDKNAALEKLFKNMGLFEKDNSQSGMPAMQELMTAIGAAAGGFKVRK